MLNKESAQSTHSRISLIKLISFLFLLALPTIIALSVQAQPPVGVKTDLGVYPAGSAPTLPRAGAKTTDPVFGTQVMRVTDESDVASFGTSYSYWATFNSNNTRVLAEAGSTAKLYQFDPVRFELGSQRSVPSPPGYGFTTTEDAIWSGTNPDVFFVHRGAAIYAFNAVSSSYTLLGDISSQLPAGSYFWQMSASRDDDVFAFTVRNPDYTVGGYCVWRRSTNRMLYNIRTPNLDEVQIDKTGRYLVVKTGQEGAGVIQDKIVDLQANPITVVNLTDNGPDFAPGHSDNGRGTVIGADNWQNRLTFRYLSSPHNLTTVLSFGNNWDTDYHISLLGDNENWALLSFDGRIASGVFDGELVLVATDGSQRVRRFAHHYSMYFNYESSARANISRDGAFVAFTSNWGGSSRHDLFIVKVPAGIITSNPNAKTNRIRVIR